MKKWKTVVLSDLHLYSKHCRASKLLKFLESNSAELWILNGDIVDIRAIMNGKGEMNKKHTRVIEFFFSQKNVIYVCGNHDEALRKLLPFQIGNIRFQNFYVYIGIDKRSYHFYHGDNIKVSNRDLTYAAAGYIYNLLLDVDHTYNTLRDKVGAEYHSLVNAIKNNLNRVQILEKNFMAEAISITSVLGYDVAVCGHIHMPHVGKHYMNPGDFSEGATGLVEDYDGSWQIIHTA